MKLKGPGRLWQLAAPSVEAENEFGKEPVVEIVESPQAKLPELVLAPPISVGIYEFDIENG